MNKTNLVLLVALLVSTLVWLGCMGGSTVDWVGSTPPNSVVGIVIGGIMGSILLAGLLGALVDLLRPPTCNGRSG